MISSTPPSPKPSSRLRLLPERLRIQHGSPSSPLTNSPNWLRFSGERLSVSLHPLQLDPRILRDQLPLSAQERKTLWRQQRAEQELAELAATTAILPEETEPWSPPPDAHPDIRLLDFVRGAWRILEPSERFVEGWHINQLCDHLEAISTHRLLEPNLLINQPPGTSKSLIVMVLWPAWEWTWAPWIRWLTTSYDEKLALRDAVKTRTLMHSEWYQRRVQEPWEFQGDQNVKGYYANDRTGWRIATSVNGGVTAHHAHRVVVDDPHNVNKVESEAVRSATLTTLKETFPSRVLPGGTRVIIGQRVHEEDATADWLEREGPKIHHIEIKEERELPDPRKPETADKVCSLTGGIHDLRHTEGELLTPERYGRDTIEQRKIELGPYAYSAQYQQSPTPRSGMMLDVGWFPQTPRLEAATVDLVMTFDLNYSDAETSDWTVGMLGAVEKSAVLPRIHIIDVLRAHAHESKHEVLLGDWILLWRPVLVGIEKRAFEKEGATRDLITRLTAYLEERNFSTTFEPITADTDKVTRAMIIPGRAKAGLVTVDKHARWFPQFQREVTSFPKGSHDDQVDTLAYLIRIVVEKLVAIRAKQGLIGKSVQVEIADGAKPSADWQRATAAGIR